MSKESESKPELKSVAGSGSESELEQEFKNSLKNAEELSFKLEESIRNIKKSESDLKLELESIQIQARDQTEESEEEQEDEDHNNDDYNIDELYMSLEFIQERIRAFILEEIGESKTRERITLMEKVVSEYMNKVMQEKEKQKQKQEQEQK